MFQCGRYKVRSSFTFFRVPLQYPLEIYLLKLRTCQLYQSARGSFTQELSYLSQITCEGHRTR